MLDLEVNKYLTIPTAELNFSFTRSSGPGGQNVNKVNSKAVLSWNIAGTTSISFYLRNRFLSLFPGKVNQDGCLIISSEESRDQKRNIEICREKLQKMLLEALKPIKKRRPTKPTRGSKEKRLKNKQQRSDTKKNRQKVSS